MQQQQQLDLFNTKDGIEIIRKLAAARKVEEMKAELARREKIAAERTKTILDEIEARRLLLCKKKLFE